MYPFLKVCFFSPQLSRTFIICWHWIRICPRQQWCKRSLWCRWVIL